MNRSDESTRTVEVLYFDGCPHYRAALALVRLLVDELQPATEVRRVRVADEDEAESLRFLGSPTVRVDGRDVEPGADARTDYVLACRVYPTDDGPAGLPDVRWIAAALEGEAAS